MIAGWADEEAAPDTNANATGEGQKQVGADGRHPAQEASYKPGQVNRNPEEEEKHNRA